MTTELETSFADLGLSAPIISALTDLGYEKPSPIQAECIPHLLNGRDVLGMGDVSLAPIDASHALAKFDLNIDMYGDGGRILGAERVPYDGRDVNRIKVVDQSGRVRVIMDDPHKQPSPPPARDDDN